MPFLDFVVRVGGYETGDDHLDELIDLLEHEPAASGLLGVGQEASDEYRSRIERLIGTLETGA